MRVLCKCHDCDRWFQHEIGPTTEARIRELIERIPRLFDAVRCDHCRSLDARNDYHIFFEPWEGLVSTDREPMNLMPALKRAGVAE